MKHNLILVMLFLFLLPLMVFAQADRPYMGCLSCPAMDPDSMNNEYGRYGSIYSPDSVNNRYSPESPQWNWAQRNLELERERNRNVPTVEGSWTPREPFTDGLTTTPSGFGTIPRR